MNINRNNYEEFFMLYADNELEAIQREKVEAFVLANPDLKQELLLFQQFKVTPDETVVFDHKASLLKQQEVLPGDAISLANYEAFFVLYADGELTGKEKESVVAFVDQNPQLQPAFQQLQLCRLIPEPSIVFQNKEILYRHEKDERVIPFFYRRMAAAAAILVFVAGGWWLRNTSTTAPMAYQPSAKPVETSAEPSKKDNALPPSNTVAVAVPAKAGNETGPKTAAKRAGRQQAAGELTSGKYPVAKSKMAPRPVRKDEVAPDVARVASQIADKDLNTVVVNTPKKAVKEPSLAAAKELSPDQPSIILTPNEENKAAFASLHDENLEVLNTSVNTKSSLRGFLRKASRLIAKKTSNDNDGRKAILVGGFEIAVR